ncbi:MAG: hypothetical protein ABSE67_14935 [Xanthobacteraceae bacterium]|jgi:uncharacterized membrane protein (GlpM family)
MSPDLLFWYGLALKMVLTATVVVITSLAVERSGPFVGALIGALPTAAGAAYTILTFEHPPSFIAASAIGSVAINAAVAIFAATYAMLAQRHGLLVSLGAATMLWFALAAALRMVDWTPLSAVAINAAVYAITIPLSWRYRTGGGPVKFVRTWFDIPLRALTVAIVVAVVTAASSSIGSFASGMFALFPIILGSSIVIMHPRIGGKATASMLAHAQLPLIGLGLGFLAVHYLVAPIGVWPALGAGLAVCLAWSGLLLMIQMRQQRRSSATSISQAGP